LLAQHAEKILDATVQRVEEFQLICNGLAGGALVAYNGLQLSYQLLADIGFIFPLR
jgi:hypothetical protein